MHRTESFHLGILFHVPCTMHSRHRLLVPHSTAGKRIRWLSSKSMVANPLATDMSWSCSKQTDCSSLLTSWFENVQALNDREWSSFLWMLIRTVALCQIKPWKSFFDRWIASQPWRHWHDQWTSKGMHLSFLRSDLWWWTLLFPMQSLRQGLFVSNRRYRRWSGLRTSSGYV